MIKPHHAEPTEDFESRFRRHLPRSNDLSLIVLKGHLLAEELIDGIVAEILPNPGALKSANLSLINRLHLTRALLPPSTLDGALAAVEKLNILRNRMAHRLEPPQLEQLIDGFLRTQENQQTSLAEHGKESTAKRLKTAIAYLCGRLCGWREGFAAVPRGRRNNSV